MTLFAAARGDGNEKVPDGAVLVTVHHERSPYNPVVVYGHLRGKGLDVVRVRETTELLDEAYPEDFALTDRALELVADARFE